MATSERGGTVTVEKAAVVDAFVEAVCGEHERKERALRAVLDGTPLRAAAAQGPIDVKTLRAVRDRYMRSLGKLSEKVKGKRGGTST